MVRLKHRYLVVHILYPSPPSTINKTFSNASPTLLDLHRPTPQYVNIPHLLRLIKHSVEYMYGDYGLGLISPSLKIMYLSPATSTAIIRIARAHYRILWAGLTWITGVENNGGGSRGDAEGQTCVFRVSRVCGTVVKAEEEVIRVAREEIGRARQEVGILLTGGALGLEGKGVDEGGGIRRLLVDDGNGGSDEEVGSEGEEEDDDGDGGEEEEHLG